MGRLKLDGERGSSDKKQRLMFVNLIYNSPATGPLYPNLWLDNQLKSLIDKSNMPALKENYELEYVIFTDEETMMGITRHPNFMALGALAKISIIKMNWPPDSDRFNARYGLLAQMFQETMKAIFDPNDKKRRDAWCGIWVADLVFARGALPLMLKKLEAGHDAVFNIPIRAAADSCAHILQKMPGAPSADELFEMAYANLHHLWTHSTWNNPYFSRIPYSMLWNSGSGLVTHNFGITPILFKPNEKMLGVKGVIDADVPMFCENPFFAENWIDAPVAGIEPLSNGHYPPFKNEPASVEAVVEFAKTGTMPEQTKYLDRPFYYPSKKRFADEGLANAALTIAREIQEQLHEVRQSNS